MKLNENNIFDLVTVLRSVMSNRGSASNKIWVGGGGDQGCGGE